MRRKWFFGWCNIKWLFVEVMNIYSNKDSYFSKKRVESGIAFAIAQWGMVYFLLHKMPVISMTDFAIWACMEFAVAGYILNQIQKEKKDNPVVTDVAKTADPVVSTDPVVSPDQSV